MCSHLSLIEMCVNTRYCIPFLTVKIHVYSIGKGQNASTVEGGMGNGGRIPPLRCQENILLYLNPHVRAS